MLSTSLEGVLHPQIDLEHVCAKRINENLLKLHVFYIAIRMKHKKHTFALVLLLATKEMI